MTSRRLPTLLLGSLGLWLMDPVPTRAAAAPERPDPAQVEFFEAKVRPLLDRHCLKCHGPEKQKGGLRLDSPVSMRDGGQSGPAVVPGDPDQSLLIEAIRYDGDIKMPPKQKLAEPEVAALTEWVRMGTPWPGPAQAPKPAPPPPAEGTSPATAAAATFWSFQPIGDPAPPAVRDPSWPVSPIDRFILAGLERAGLHPSPPADKRTLIRRASFDLTGLPPTPEEVDAFLADESPEAFARVVDRLLASPHYGERWGRHWLDIARYGEDQAHSFQPRLYPQGFRYRDWVVAALNADLPYDRFLMEQVAADLLDEPGRLERLPALGFFACGPVYYGDAKKFDQIDDRIDTLTRGVLGLTVACARCHDHKYDPIPQADYYALAGVIASTDYEETPLVPPDQVEAYERYQEAIASSDQQINAFLQAEADRMVAGRGRGIAAYLVAAWTLDRRRQADPKVTAAEVARSRGLDPTLLERWAAYLARRDAVRAQLPAWSALLDSPERSICPAEDEPARLGEVAAVAQATQDRVLALLARRARGQTITDPAEKMLVDELVGPKGILTIPKARLEPALEPEARALLAALRADREALAAAAPPKYPIAHALKEGKPRNLRVLARGNADAPGPEAPRRFLTVLGGTPLAQGSGRLELARALVRPENPLTARVLVNRVWQHHFGRGLVGTPSNFGALGDRPSHPELLDYLARRFIASGWSLKSLHRTIVLSATYRQSSQFDSHAAEVDPENRLLWRASRRRLEVEAWRDALLAVSGRLDPTVGGPSRRLDDPANRRRTLYAAISRHNLDGLLRLFDFPDPNITSAERTRTTVPLQQLFVLNDELMVQAARAFAARVAAGAGPDADDAARVRRAYQLAFGRPPTGDEVRLALAYLGARDTEAEGRPAADLTRWERYAQALLGSNEFTFID